MTDKLSLFNGALAALGESRLVSLAENVEPRYILSDIWDRDALNTVLKSGQWNFAGRTAELDYSPSITPSFGYQYAFPKPDDFVRTMAVCHDEYLGTPLLQYQDEANVWFCDEVKIYVQYVSNDPQWGGDFSLWPSDFTRWVELWLALQAAPVMTHSDGVIENITMREKEALSKAKNGDAMESPTKQPPEGRWVGARRGPRGSRTDLGYRNRLIG